MMLAATEGTRCPARPRAAPRVPRVDRRALPVVRAPRSSDPLRLRSRAVATTTRRNVVVAASAESSRDGNVESKRRYVNFTGFPFPLVPFLSRRTVVNEVVKGKVWTLEQEQGIGFDLGVSTNVRCTIVKMRDGRLWVHDPIAPAEYQAKLYMGLGNAHKQWVTVPGGDHAAFLEAPRDYFLHALTAFLAGIGK